MILGMDEMPMYFDLIPGRTLSKKGKQQVSGEHLRQSAT